MSESQAIVRINGVLPEISTLGTEEESERAAEVKRTGMTANTSCSVFVKGNTTLNKEIFHLLIDIGAGVVTSLEKIDISSSNSSFSNLNLKSSPATNTIANTPDAILITHSHDDHIKELPLIIRKVFD